MISRIDHIAIAVQDYDKAFKFFTNILGARPGASDKDQAMKYLWQTLSLGDLSRLELLTPTGTDSFLDNFLKNRQGGVHHITMQTPDIEMAKANLEKHNIPYFGFHDYGPVWKELFIHPKDAFGVLIQIVELRPDDWLPDSVKMPGKNKWEIESIRDEIQIRFSHPGGGTVNINLDKSDARKLIGELSSVLESN